MSVRFFQGSANFDLMTMLFLIYINFPLDSISQVPAYLCDYFYTCATRMQSLQVTLLHQNIDADKCINSFHLKRLMTFSKLENQTFYYFILNRNEIVSSYYYSLSYSISPKRLDGFSLNFQGWCILVQKDRK